MPMRFVCFVTLKFVFAVVKHHTIRFFLVLKMTNCLMKFTVSVLLVASILFWICFAVVQQQLLLFLMAVLMMVFSFYIAYQERKWNQAYLTLAAATRAKIAILTQWNNISVLCDQSFLFGSMLILYTISDMNDRYATLSAGIQCLFWLLLIMNAIVNVTFLLFQNSYYHQFAQDHDQEVV